MNAVTVPDVSEAARRYVEVFAEGWRAPTDADALADHFEPWLDPQFRFNQPLVGGTLVGVQAFREHFARTTFELLSDIRVTVESWAANGETLFIEVRIEANVGSRAVTLRACDRFILRDGRPFDRVTYFDALPLLSAILRSPRLWTRAARVTLRANRAARATA
jgi:hypothetical protein